MIGFINIPIDEDTPLVKDRCDRECSIIMSGISIIITLWSLFIVIGIDYPLPHLNPKIIAVLAVINILYLSFIIVLVYRIFKKHKINFYQKSIKLLLASLMFTSYCGVCALVGRYLSLLFYNILMFNVISFGTANIPLCSILLASLYKLL